MPVDPYLDRIEYRGYVIEKEPLVPRTNPSFQWNDPLAVSYTHLTLPTNREV